MNPRTCIVTRREMLPEEMIRFVCGPNEQIVPDIKQCLPGRGVWVTANKEKIEEAEKRQVFRHGFKSKSVTAKGLADLTGKLLYDDALAALSITKKAGLAVTGKSKVNEQIRKGRVALVIHATDAAADGVEKIDTLVAAITREEDIEILIRRAFSGGELDKALGGSNVTHLALLSGGATENLIVKLERLEKFWSEPGK